MRSKAVLVIIAAFCANHVHAQGYSASNIGDRKHLDLVGKPCIETSGVVRPLVSNPRILDHAVSLDNHCVDKIKVKICYYASDNCTDVEVPGRTRKEQVIGVFPAMQQFRYEVKEQFERP